MIWVYGILLFLFLFMLLIAFTKLTITVEYCRIGKNDDLKVKVRAWGGLLRYTFKVPVIKANEKDMSVSVVKESNMGQEKNSGKSQEDHITESDVKTGIRDFKELAGHITGLHTIARKFLKHIEITQFEWHTRFGLGDSASTGSTAGMLWTIKGLMCGAAGNYMKLKTQPVLSIVPIFQGLCLDTMVTGMVRFRIGHAIIGGLRFVKYWKGGKPSFGNKPLSKIFGEHNNTA
ncbi:MULTISPECIES: DUF2953 domain-containing protein [Bacillaceae]|uniref:DUF2953 domain-containing protein n=1 Tax=Metabacillus sediminis TaxID=3117746 RepID=A0ABZ2NER1_9BACI|nr:DUF2953 domain-containing protein [Bacillus sp. SJS]KZZ85663.1 hypothetical protein AS29_003485 [Bacillus sp. SJS]